MDNNNSGMNMTTKMTSKTPPEWRSTPICISIISWKKYSHVLFLLEEQRVMLIRLGKLNITPASPTAISFIRSSALSL